MSLYNELMAERFGKPVRSDRPRIDLLKPLAGGNLFEIVAEMTRPREARVVDDRADLGVRCQYAACDRMAVAVVDAWTFCYPHKLRHMNEVAS